MEKIPRKNWDLLSAVEWNCWFDASGVAENCGGVFQRGEADGCDVSGEGGGGSLGFTADLRPRPGRRIFRILSL